MSLEITLRFANILFCNVMFKLENEAVINQIYTDLHTIPE